MSHRNRVCLVILVAAWWSMTGGLAAAQTWKDILGVGTEEEQPKAEEPQPVDNVEAEAALKEALLVAAENSVAEASRVDGFNGNAEIRIPMPPKLEMAGESLTRWGLGREVDDFELAMNRAAEGSAADALPLLRDAIRDLLIDDPLATLWAGGSAATDTLRAGAGENLLEWLTPIVREEMERAEVAGAYDRLELSLIHI